MANIVRCGYLDNIIFDFEGGRLPVDPIYNNTELFAGLTWKEQSNILKWYSLALKQGANGVYHLKMVYTVAKIIKKYHKRAKYYNRFLTVSPKYF